MKRLAVLFVLLTAPVSAKDLTITLTDAEQQTFVQALDTFQKQGGLQVSEQVLAIFHKLQQAAQASPPAPDVPQGGTK